MKARRQINDFYNKNIYQKYEHLVLLPYGNQAKFQDEKPLGRIVNQRYEIELVFTFLIKHMKANDFLLEDDERNALIYYGNELHRILFGGDKETFDLANRHHRIVLESHLQENDLLKVPTELMLPLLWQFGFAERAVLRQVSRSMKAIVDEYVVPELFYIPRKMPELAFYVFGYKYPEILQELANLTEEEKNQIGKSIGNFIDFENKFLKPNFFIKAGMFYQNIYNTNYISKPLIVIQWMLLIFALKKLIEMPPDSIGLINSVAEVGVYMIALPSCIPLLGESCLYMSSKQGERSVKHYLDQFSLQEKPTSSFKKYALLGATAAGLLGFSFFASKCEAPCLLDAMPELSKPKV